MRHSVQVPDTPEELPLPEEPPLGACALLDPEELEPLLVADGALLCELAEPDELPIEFDLPLLPLGEAAELEPVELLEPVEVAELLAVP